MGRLYGRRWQRATADGAGRVEASAERRDSPSVYLPDQGGQRPGKRCVISWSTQPLPSGSLKVA